MNTVIYTWPDIKEIQSSDENVKKFVFAKDDAVAESVLYKYPTYEERTVICCSPKAAALSAAGSVAPGTASSET